MVNPGEMHDGTPVGGAARGWRILYLDPALVAREIAGDNVTRETVRTALTEQQASVTKFASTTENKDKKDEKKQTEVITTTTSCKPA